MQCADWLFVLQRMVLAQGMIITGSHDLYPVHAEQILGLSVVNFVRLSV